MRHIIFNLALLLVVLLASLGAPNATVSTQAEVSPAMSRLAVEQPGTQGASFSAAQLDTLFDPLSLSGADAGTTIVSGSPDNTPMWRNDSSS